jgi:NADH dehydrogenase
LQQAKHLLGSLEGVLAGREPTAFAYDHQGALVRLGRYNAFGSLGKRGLLGNGWFVQGRFAQLSYASLYRRHQLGLFGLGRALLYWFTDLLRHLGRPRVKLE